MSLKNALQFAILCAISYGAVVVLDQKMNTKSSPRVLYLRSLMMALLVVVLYQETTKKEMFLFELSPSKTVDCCPKGFNGMPIEFHYEGDSTRFANCPEQDLDVMFPKKTTNYELLENVGNPTNNCPKCKDKTIENYCGAKHKVRESYCGSCVSSMV